MTNPVERCRYHPAIDRTDRCSIRPDDAYWRDLESNAHLPDVQEVIRQEVQRGTIRVRPKPGGGIRIVPVGIPESG